MNIIKLKLLERHTHLYMIKKNIIQRNYANKLLFYCLFLPEGQLKFVYVFKHSHHINEGQNRNR